MSSKGYFSSYRKEEIGPNKGSFNIPGKESLKTPVFMPIINIITGPPTLPEPTFANGGIWRWIKVLLLKKKRIPAFMSQVLHFTDFPIDKKTLARWIPKPSTHARTVHEIISKDSGYNPYLFVDSGGYKLLYNETIDLRPFDLEASVEGILSLQNRFGGDFIASLDYPIRLDISDSEATSRIGKSISNAVKAAKIIHTENRSDILFYAAIHGRNKEEARKSVHKLALALRQAKVDDIHLGVAIGSLVPLHNSPADILNIVRGVVDGVRDENWIGLEDTIPIHAFGVSGPIMPLVAAFGVDTFDSNSYVQSAMNLKYMATTGIGTVDFLKIDKDQMTCNCEWCRMLDIESHFQGAREILHSQSNIYHNYPEELDRYDLFKDGHQVNKSYIYALIALHNYEVLVRRVHLITKNPDEFVTQISTIKGISNNLDRISPGYTKVLQGQLLDRIDSISKMKISHKRRSSRKNPDRDSLLKWLDESELGNLRRKRSHEVSLDYSPEDFDIFKINYKPKNSNLMLILACTQQKPYSKSPTHKFIMRHLTDQGIKSSMFEKVTISGNYGPVPEEFENRKEILGYDYHLTSLDTNRMDILTERTARFFRKYEKQFDVIIAYITSKSYREVIENAMEKVTSERIILLPVKPKIRRLAELRKEENLGELVSEMKRFLKG